MRQILAYVLLIVGVPNYIGLIVGGLVRAPLAWAFPLSLRTRVIQFGALFCGFGAIAAAVLLFWLLGVAPGWAIPLICGIWVSTYFVLYDQSRFELFWFLAGIWVGWIVLYVAVVRPNQAMQRTASPRTTYLMRVCHPPFLCERSHSGLAVADLVSR